MDLAGPVIERYRRRSCYFYRRVVIIVIIARTRNDWSGSKRLARWLRLSSRV